MRPDNPADAPLIAAAPELLGLLKESAPYIAHEVDERGEPEAVSLDGRIRNLLARLDEGSHKPS